jgi:hypothetical protein
MAGDLGLRFGCEGVAGGEVDDDSFDGDEGNDDGGEEKREEEEEAKMEII